MSVTEIKKSSAPKETGSGMERFNAIKPGTNVAYTTLFILLAVLCVIPVVFVIIISFSSEASIGKVGYSFVPAEWSTDAYDYVWHLRNTRGIPTIILAFLTSVGLTVVGTLIEVGRGRLSIDDFKKVIEGKQRSDAGESMPGNALFLEDIVY